jgi:hypothetical protein
MKKETAQTIRFVIIFFVVFVSVFVIFKFLVPNVIKPIWPPVVTYSTESYDCKSTYAGTSRGAHSYKMPRMINDRAYCIQINSQHISLGTVSKVYFYTTKSTTDDGIYTAMFSKNYYSLKQVPSDVNPELDAFVDNLIPR